MSSHLGSAGFSKRAQEIRNARHMPIRVRGVVWVRVCGCGCGCGRVGVWVRVRVWVWGCGCGYIYIYIYAYIPPFLPGF